PRRTRSESAAAASATSTARVESAALRALRLRLATLVVPVLALVRAVLGAGLLRLGLLLARGLRLRRLGLLGPVDELDDADFRSVAQTRTLLQDARVAAVAGLVARAQLVEELPEDVA